MSKQFFKVLMSVGLGMSLVNSAPKSPESEESPQSQAEVAAPGRKTKRDVKLSISKKTSWKLLQIPENITNITDWCGKWHDSSVEKFYKIEKSDKAKCGKGNFLSAKIDFIFENEESNLVSIPLELNHYFLSGWRNRKLARQNNPNKMPKLEDEQVNNFIKQSKRPGFFLNLGDASSDEEIETYKQKITDNIPTEVIMPDINKHLSNIRQDITNSNKRRTLFNIFDSEHGLFFYLLRDDSHLKECIKKDVLIKQALDENFLLKKIILNVCSRYHTCPDCSLSYKLHSLSKNIIRNIVNCLYTDHDDSFQQNLAASLSPLHIIISSTGPSPSPKKEFDINSCDENSDDEDATPLPDADTVYKSYNKIEDNTEYIMHKCKHIFSQQSFKDSKNIQSPGEQK